MLGVKNGQPKKTGFCLLQYYPSLSGLLAPVSANTDTKVDTKVRKKFEPLRLLRHVTRTRLALKIFKTKCNAQKSL